MSSANPKHKKSEKNEIQSSKTDEKKNTEFEKFGGSIKRSFNRFYGLTLKELKILITDRTAMLIAYALPVVIIILLAWQGNAMLEEFESVDRPSKPTEPPIIGVIDADDSTLSHEFLALMQDYEVNEYCTLVFSEDTSSYQAEKNDLLNQLGRNEINCIVVIPPMFDINLTTHMPAILEVVFDTIDTNHIQPAQEIVDGMVEEFKAANGFTGVFETDLHKDGVPEEGRLLFMASPLLFPLILFSIGSLTASQSIVSDIPKDRMVLTPTNKYEMLAAKTTALQIIMSGLIIVSVGLSMLLGLQINGSIIGYFFLLSVVALSGIIWGMLVSALADVPLNAFQYFIFMLLFQIIIVFFVDSGAVLRTIPVYNARQLLMNVTMRGEPLAWNFGYLSDILIEIGILYILTQWLFNRRKTML